MAITGYLAEFSLAELFQLIEQGHKTGLLTIAPVPEPSDPNHPRSHYIWFNQGRVVAAANRSDHRGLITLISRRGWLSDRAAARLCETCGQKSPLGILLKTQGLLESEQLKLLFYVQVMRQVCNLFALTDGWFHFDGKALIPMQELTGVSAPANEVTLAGLRALRDWRALDDKLPAAASALMALSEGRPHHLKLNQNEWQLWEFTHGTVSLSEMATHLQLPVEKVRQIAFRLIVVGLVEEIPLVAPDPVPSAIAPDVLPPEGGEVAGAVSHSFLNDLMSFLTGRT